MERTVLREIIPDESRLVFDHIPPEFLSDTLGRRKGEASALVFAKSTEEVSKLLQYAHANRIPVTPRGAGTNLVGSTVPVDGGIILDLSQMNRILELDTETMTITVEPGLLLQDLQAYVEEHNLFYPPDPGEKASSIGGNISTNAGGMRAVKYGVTRDYVRGLEVVTADGTVLTVGGKNVKDASGLSLKHLYIGSEGTLAVITKCILKVIPKPETSLSILVPYPDLTTGIGSVLNILRADANPTAVEFMERNVVRVGEDFSGVRYPCPEAGSYILLTFDGREGEVAASAERIQTLALSSGALDYIFLTDPQQAADIWKVRGALVKAVEAVSEQEPVDIVVPINRTAEFIGAENAAKFADGVEKLEDCADLNDLTALLAGK
jgi:glycolate oxidase